MLIVSNYLFFFMQSLVKFPFIICDGGKINYFFSVFAYIPSVNSPKISLHINSWDYLSAFTLSMFHYCIYSSLSTKQHSTCFHYCIYSSLSTKQHSTCFHYCIYSSLSTKQHSTCFHYCIYSSLSTKQHSTCFKWSCGGGCGTGGDYCCSDCHCHCSDSCTNMQSWNKTEVCGELLALFLGLTPSLIFSTYT